ncbi:MAG TPA: hypothetical protein VE644_13000 [Gaiellaceae bacterium]|nr:hypothetical protein [Gaiellaceae bacterium]
MSDGFAPRAVLVSGATRRAGIAAAVALRLARDGWNVATSGWRAYDEEEWGARRPGRRRSS